MAEPTQAFTVRAKLLFMVILMNGLLLIAGSFVVARLFIVANGYEHFRERTVQFSNINAVSDDLSSLRRSLDLGLRAAMVDNGRWPQTAVDQIATDLKSLRVRIALLEKNHPEDADALILNLEDLMAALDESLVRMKLKPSEAYAILLKLADHTMPAVSKQLTSVIQAELAEVDRVQASITRGDIQALRNGLIGIALSLIAGLAISYGIFDMVIRPLSTTHKALLQVLSGNFRGISLRQSQDEIGAIGRVIEDIKARSEHVYRLAYSDILTGLPNRLQLARDLGETMRSAGDRRSYSLLLLGVDRFSALSSSFGPRFGDEAIQEIHRRLGLLLNEGGRLYRYTGDIFACLLKPSSSDDAAQVAATQVADAISMDFRTPLLVGELSIPLSLSIGVALSLQKVRPENMLVEAEAALFEAKRRGGTNTVIGMRDFAERTRRRLEIASAIRRGLTASEFEPFFQPVIDIERGVTVGAETLVRWRHADGRITMPGEFIFIAEESDLIRDITIQMTGKACDHLARWKRDGYKLKLAFNVSARLVTIGLKQIVLNAIEASGISPADLEMEITETVLIGNHNEAEKLLIELRESGLRLALDDFGSGYSSMNYLSRFQVDKIKIDQTFVQSLSDGERQREVVSAMIKLAHALKIDVVAEGVETLEQMELLRSLGCRLMQGWLFAAALPAQEFPPWMDSTSALLSGIKARSLSGAK